MATPNLFTSRPSLLLQQLAARRLAQAPAPAGGGLLHQIANAALNVATLGEHSHPGSLMQYGGDVLRSFDPRTRAGALSLAGMFAGGRFPKGMAPTGTVFHGSPEGELAPSAVNEFTHTRPWKEGIGLYVTNSATRARGYARGRTAIGERLAGASSRGAVSTFTVKPGAKVLQMDAPVDHLFWMGMAKGMGWKPGEYQQYIGNYLPRGRPATNADVRDEFLQALHEEHGSDAPYALEDAYASQGVQATTHVEGLKSNPHRVWVVKDPSIVQG